MKVYVVIESWVVDYDSGRTIAIYNTKEKALEDFKERIKSAKIDMGFDNDEDDIIDEGNMVEEQEEDSYVIYEDGYYSRNHICIDIEEEEVK